MASEDFERKLTTVLSADVAGYSRLEESALLHVKCWGAAVDWLTS